MKPFKCSRVTPEAAILSVKIICLTCRRNFGTAVSKHTVNNLSILSTASILRIVKLSLFEICVEKASVVLDDYGIFIEKVVIIVRTHDKVNDINGIYQVCTGLCLLTCISKCTAAVVWREVEFSRVF